MNMKKKIAEALLSLYNEFGDDFGGADESDLWRDAIITRINALGFSVVAEKINGHEVTSLRAD